MKVKNEYKVEAGCRSRKKFEKILFPVDFSECCLKTLKYLELNNLADEVVLLHVIDTNNPLLDEAGFYTSRIIDSLKNRAGERLGELTERLRQQGINANYMQPLTGDVVECIIDTSERENAEILIGSHGNNPETLIGIVAEKVIKRAKMPVLLVKPKIVRRAGAFYCEIPERSLFDRILYPCDISYSFEALDYIKKMSLNGTGEIVLLKTDHVEEAMEWLARGGINLKVIETEISCEEIIRVAKEEKATLIAIQETLGFDKTLTEAVVRHSEIPVFVYKL